MATQSTSYSTSNTYSSHPRFMPKSALRTIRIQAEVAAHTYLPGTLFTRASGGDLELWRDGQEIYCVLWDRKVTTSTSGEVQATFMIDGHFHRDDVVTVDDAGTDLDTIAGTEHSGNVTSAGIDTACRSVELAKLGFHVDGLAGGV